MLPFPIVEDLDVLKGYSADLDVCGVANAMHPLIFEAVEPTLGWCFIPLGTGGGFEVKYALR